jgi:hypothetical protein
VRLGNALLEVSPRFARSSVSFAARREAVTSLMARACVESIHSDRAREAAACCVLRIAISRLMASTFSPGCARAIGMSAAIAARVANPTIFRNKICSIKLGKKSKRTKWRTDEPLELQCSPGKPDTFVLVLLLELLIETAK